MWKWLKYGAEKQNDKLIYKNCEISIEKSMGLIYRINLQVNKSFEKLEIKLYQKNGLEKDIIFFLWDN